MGQREEDPVGQERIEGKGFGMRAIAIVGVVVYQDQSRLCAVQHRVVFPPSPGATPAEERATSERD